MTGRKTVNGHESDPNGCDALPLEYKLENRSAGGHGNVADVVNNIVAFGEFRVLGDTLSEHPVELTNRKRTVLR